MVGIIGPIFKRIDWLYVVAVLWWWLAVPIWLAIAIPLGQTLIVPPAHIVKASEIWLPASYVSLNSIRNTTPRDLFTGQGIAGTEFEVAKRADFEQMIQSGRIRYVYLLPLTKWGSEIRVSYVGREESSTALYNYREFIVGPSGYYVSSFNLEGNVLTIDFAEDYSDGLLWGVLLFFGGILFLVCWWILYLKFLKKHIPPEYPY